MSKPNIDQFEHQPFTSYFHKFLVWSLGSLVLLFFILGIVQRVFESGLRERMLVSHERGLDMAEQLIHVELLRAVQDAHLLGRLESIQSFMIDPDNPLLRRQLEADLSSFADSYGLYDQIRLLSLQGQELVRITYENSSEIITPVSELKDRSGRYYIEQGNQLTGFEVYISPLELNTEQGQVVVPHQPVIRIVQKLSSELAGSGALLVLNYKANNLLNNFRSLFRADERGMLINADGYWVSNHDRQNEWGWQTGHAQQTLANWNPALWQQLQSEVNGRFDEDQMSFSYRRIKPAGANSQTLDGHYATDLGVLPELQNSTWYAIVQTNFSERLNGTFFRSWAGYLIIVLLIFGCLVQAFLIARYRATRSHYIREMKDLYDNAPVGYLTIDSQGYIQRVNRAIIELIGFTKSEIVGKMKLTELLNNPDAFNLEKPKQSEQQSKKIKQKRLSLKHKNGETIPAVCSFSPRFNGSGALVLSRCSVQDFREQAELEEALKFQARTDPLTGTFNRRYFWELANQQIAQTNAQSSSLSVLLLDIDHFKHINDTFGHTDGDAALILVAQRCAKQLRKNDILARFGGEEFVILLPGANLDQASQKAEELRNRIASEPIILSGNKPITVTVSIGVASVTADEMISLDQLLNLADTRLYLAKNAGRNQVCAK